MGVKCVHGRSKGNDGFSIFYTVAFFSQATSKLVEVYTDTLALEVHDCVNGYSVVNRGSHTSVELRTDAAQCRCGRKFVGPDDYPSCKHNTCQARVATSQTYKHERRSDANVRIL